MQQQTQQTQKLRQQRQQRHQQQQAQLRQLIRSELTGWKAWEITWLLLACLSIVALSVYWKDTVIGIVSATTGVACVVCTGKGKLSAYLFGLVNVILYAYIAYQARYYGEVMLNIIYYLPMQFYGFYVWKQHMNEETCEVEKRSMTPRGRILLLVSVAGGTAGYGLVLRALGGALPFVDALSTVVSVIAMIVSIRRYMEQWVLWIFVDSVTVVMWAVAFAGGSGSIATLLMWAVYLVNAVIMYIKWRRDAQGRAPGAAAEKSGKEAQGRAPGAAAEISRKEAPSDEV